MQGTQRKLQKIMALVCAVLLLVTVLPAGLFGWPDEVEAAGGPEEVTVLLSYQADDSGFVIARSEFKVAADLSENYGYEDAFSGEKVTAFDAIVAAHIAVYGTSKDTIAKKLTIENDFISNFMGYGDGNMNFLVNNEVAQIGATGVELKKGDVVELFRMHDAFWSDAYAWFEVDGKRTEAVRVGVNKQLKLNVKSLLVDYGSYPEFITIEKEVAVGGAGIVPVTVSGSKGAFGQPLKITDEDGNATVTFEKSGTYILSLIDAGVNTGVPLLSPWLVVTVGTSGGGGGGGITAPVPAPVVPVTAPVITKADLTYISGSDRVGTSAAISQAFWPNGSERVIIAPGANANLIDVVGSASIAGQWNAPTLMTVNKQISEAVLAEIGRLGAKQIAIVGAVSQAEVDSIKARYPNAEILLLQGQNRYETIALINAQVKDPQGVIYIGADAVADAVSLGSWAAAHGYIFELARPDGKVDTGRVHSGLDQIILGGPQLVQDITGAKRIYGATRYETNQAILKDAKFDFKYDTVFTTNGDTLVDGVAGAAAAAQTGSFITLAPAGNPAGLDFGGKITATTQFKAFGGK